MSDRIHVYPLDKIIEVTTKKGNKVKRHTSTNCTDKSGMCWCKPRVMQGCSEWEPENGRNCKPDCWRCGGVGLVEPYDFDYSMIIIHNKEKRPCYPYLPDEELAAK